MYKVSELPIIHLAPVLYGRTPVRCQYISLRSFIRTRTWPARVEKSRRLNAVDKVRYRGSASMSAD